MNARHDQVRLEPGPGGQALLRLDRPERRNALTVAMWRAIPDLIATAVADPAVRVVFVRGSGGHFAAGADIGEMPAVYGSAEAATANDAIIQAAMRALETCPKPTIALIEGACVGGGCGLALACDMRIGATGSRYGITPARLGLVYGRDDARRLVQAVGMSQARDLLFTGRLLEADAALAAGLIDRLVAADVLDQTAEAQARILAAASPASIAAQKRVLAGLDPSADAAAAAAESRALFAAAFSSADFAEGWRAFVDKRPPTFPGLTALQGGKSRDGL